MPRPISRIDYTAKDYASLREEVMRLARIYFPEWNDTSPGDPGVMLVELMCHLTDMMLHYQERIAAECFPSTASELRSVVDLLRLIGYEFEFRHSARAVLKIKCYLTKEQIKKEGVPPLPLYSKFSTSPPAAIDFLFIPGDDISTNALALPNLPGQYEILIAHPQLPSHQFPGYFEQEYLLSREDFCEIEVYDDQQRRLPLFRDGTNRPDDDNTGSLSYAIAKEPTRIRLLSPIPVKSSETLFVAYDTIDGQSPHWQARVAKIRKPAIKEQLEQGIWRRIETQTAPITVENSQVRLADPYQYRGKLLRFTVGTGAEQRTLLYGATYELPLDKTPLSLATQISRRNQLFYIPWDEHSKIEGIRLGIANTSGNLTVYRDAAGAFRFEYPQSLAGFSLYLFSTETQILCKLTNVAKVELGARYDKMWLACPEDITASKKFLFIEGSNEKQWRDFVAGELAGEVAIPSVPYLEFSSLNGTNVRFTTPDGAPQITIVTGVPAETRYDTSQISKDDLTLYLQDGILQLDAELQKIEIYQRPQQQWRQLFPPGEMKLDPKKRERLHYLESDDEYILFFPVIQGHLQSEQFQATAEPLQMHPLAATTTAEMFSNSWVQLQIDGEPWQQRDNFLDSGQEDRHYTIRLQAQHNRENYAILFGDGINGKIPQGKIEVKYLTALGSQGNVARNTLIHYEIESLGKSQTLTNSKPASGGRDLQSLQEAMRQAPKSLRSMQRAVSHNDFVAIAEKFPGVWRAAVEEFRYRQVLLYAMPNHKDQAIPAGLAGYVEERRPLTIAVQVLPPIYLQLHVAIVLTGYVLPGYQEQTVARALWLHLRNYFDVLDFNQGEDILTRNRLKMEAAHIAGVDPRIKQIFGRPQQEGGIYIAKFKVDNSEKLYRDLKDYNGKDLNSWSEIVTRFSYWLGQERGIALKLVQWRTDEK